MSSILDRHWLIILCGLLMLMVLLAVLRPKKSDRSVLYLGALKLQYAICFCAALLPTIATVMEEIPERFMRAWYQERADQRLEMVQRRKLA